MKRFLRYLGMVLAIGAWLMVSTNIVNCGYDNYDSSECADMCEKGLGIDDCYEECGRDVTRCIGRGEVEEGGGCADDECKCEVDQCIY